MFDFDFELPGNKPLGQSKRIIPVFGGTPYIHLVKAEVAPATATASGRLDLHLEKREPNKPVEKSKVSIWDFTAKKDGEKPSAKEYKDEPIRITNMLAVFRPDLSDQQLRDTFKYRNVGGVKVPTQNWMEVLENFVEALPADVADSPNTWYLRAAGSNLKIPLQWNVVRRGNEANAFKMDAQYDKMEYVNEGGDIPVAPTPFNATSAETSDDLPF